MKKGVPEILQSVIDVMLPSKVEVSGGFGAGLSKRYENKAFTYCTHIRVKICNQDDLTEFKQKFPYLTSFKRLKKLEIMGFSKNLPCIKLTENEKKAFTSGRKFTVSSYEDTPAILLLRIEI